MSYNPNLKGLKPLKVGRNIHNTTHTNTFSSQFGKLTPVDVTLCIPGRRVKQSIYTQVEVAPLVAPLNGRILLRQHTFFVPMRLLWDRFKDFITNKDRNFNLPSPPADWFPDRVSALGAADPEDVFLFNRDFGPGSIRDYLGYTSTPKFSQSQAEELDSYDFQKYPLALENVMRLRAYYLIWYEYFRQSDMPVSFMEPRTDTEPEAFEMNILVEPRYATLRSDYFATALTEPQQGPNVSFAPLLYFTDNGFGENANFGDLSTDSIDTNQTGISIPDLWEAEATQKWAYINNISGDQYISQLYVRYGVVSSDASLQRPQFVGYHQQDVSVYPVLSNAGTEQDILGDYAGHASSRGKSRPVRYFAEEWGYLITLQSIVPEVAYCDGYAHDILFKEPTDFFLPEFQHIGDEAIPMAERYAPLLSSDEWDVLPPKPLRDPNYTWGYAMRNYSYRERYNEIHGDFRDSLSFWTLRAPTSIGPVDYQTREIRPEFYNNIFAVTDPSVDTFFCYSVIQQSLVDSVATYDLPMDLKM